MRAPSRRRRTARKARMRSCTWTTKRAPRPKTCRDPANGRGAIASMAAMYESGTMRVKTGFPEMQKGGVIMDVVNPEQAVIAAEAGAVAVMALERVPADIRAQGGVARMSDPDMIRGIQEA